MAASSEMAWPRFCSVLLLVLLQALRSSSIKSKPITTSLQAKWPATPLVAEASEFLADKGVESFWSFVDSLSELRDGDVGETDESKYAFVMKFAGRLLSDTERDLLKLTLSIHSYSPKIEMFNQIAQDLPPPSGCDAFVHVHGQVTCSLTDMAELIASAPERAKPNVYAVDHRYPRSQNNSITVILYGHIGNLRSQVKHFHQRLKGLANKGTVQYVLRHFVKDQSAQRIRLSGYGVELAIKSTEYKAVDDTEVKEGDGHSQDEEDNAPDEVQGFIFSKLKELHPDLVDNLNSFRASLLESNRKMVPLKVWQLQTIAFQAAQRVLSSPTKDALRVLREISQNFPLLASSLVKTQVKDEVRKEITENQKIFEATYGVGEGDTIMMLNGLVIDTDVAEPFLLLELLRSESQILDGLYSLGVSGEASGQLMRVQVASHDGTYAVDIRDNSVLYLNDLEKDERYAHWPSGVQEFLRPMFPGMLRQIKKNVFHLIFMLDPTQPESLQFLQQAEMFVLNEIPVTVGVVFVVSKEDEVNWREDAGVAMMRAFNFAMIDGGSPQALDLLIKILTAAEDEVVTPENVVQTFKKMFPGEDLDEILGPGTEYDDRRQDGKAYFERTGLGSLPQVMMNGVPFTSKQLQPDEFEESVVTAILMATPDLQRAVYRGKINDRTNLMDYLMAQPNVMPRLNPRILADDTRLLDLTAQPGDLPNLSLSVFQGLSTSGQTAAVTNSMKYLTKKDDLSLRPVSMWIVCDLETTEGRMLVSNANKYMKTSNTLRIGVISNTADSSDNRQWLARAIHSVQKTQTRNHAKNFINKLLKEENYQSIEGGKTKVEDYEVHGMNMGAFKQAFKESEFLKIQRVFSDKVLHLLPGQRAVIASGRVFGPLSQDEQFTEDDFSLAEKLILQTSAASVKKKMEKLASNFASTGDSLSDLTLKVDALLASNSRQEGRKEVSFWRDKHSVIDIPPRDQSKPCFDIVAILDPLSSQAQKWSHILGVLKEVINVKIRIFMNPKDKLSEMPLKRFYRYVLEPELSFRVDSSLTAGPMAKFSDMPPDTLLTLNLLTPESWLVEPVRTAHDLDNIKLSESEMGIHGQYELEYLLVEGHCFDQASGQPPRGLQFTLGNQQEPVIQDTIVMANLGYFQLKANPGAWLLRLRHGRSADIYQVSGHEGTDSLPGVNDTIITMDSFKSKIIKIKVNKKPGKEDESLLSDSQTDKRVAGGIWDSLSSLTGSGGKEGDSDQDKTLNIFSIASGHLYERFLRIMMLSVLKNTKSPVKFWFLKNYLSPTFKEFIPHMAAEYGFEYELVQYKWPRWLHQQTEKQRLIWGYKILFLDVLFPLDVKKIIFVDADQIVRADLQELANLNLQGAPYGYTPFCASRREMDGFRFWNSGYWKSHLAGRKYHISALYVVDLVKFRKIAAGDRLRGQYQALSQDPNSLSNLDQDLPNNMIHQVAIHSLPQEWLWCETWCSDAEKPAAKTIDLCNNPLTKEPKLESAVRIVPEWTGYDNEIKALQERVAQGLTTQSVGGDKTQANPADDHTEL
ncbi:UDP-glucose:glycoprotein glucosyltransferase 1-like isoform X2 [Acanthaster planci]|uniref:UDP-glucose:glycoprotein glucosyltransferase 1-like isoform X2 n=1 Tax=Acanthaster planci TaxID=133434 RepID=A0A8B7YVB7_ACAPL|nr:UDP-glucose:glycoprotein glucosyltransferase 1-like isoform X2 [Acanthaster planci]